MRRRSLAFASLCLLLVLAACAGPRPGEESAPPPSPVLRAFEQRLAAVERNLPMIERAAEAAAVRTMAYPGLLINAPYSPQPSFAEEMMNRSGCLANVLPDIERPKQTTDLDIFLFSVRSWEQDGVQAVKMLRDARARHWLIVLSASRAGAPPGVEADYWIDNGGTGTGAAEAPINAIINVVHGWLWQVEYAAALTRRGKHPGVLQHILEPGSETHNQQVQSREGRPRIYDYAGQPIPDGWLGGQYLAAIRQMVNRVGSLPTLTQVYDAADVAASQFTRGGKVGLAAANHILLYEIFHNLRAPWHPFNVVWQTKNGAFEKNVGPDDLLVFFGHVGPSTPYEDYGGAMQRVGVPLIVSYAPDRADPANDVTNAVARIDQTWTMPDAVVSVPFPPGRMAPVSGIEQGLLFRMLDDAVARKLAAAK
ncbi:hypothetical protein HQ590_06835 [bacterium]|nr:hypothetical protein [bacterium]